MAANLTEPAYLPAIGAAGSPGAPRHRPGSPRVEFRVNKRTTPRYRRRAKVWVPRGPSQRRRRGVAHTWRRIPVPLSISSRPRRRGSLALALVALFGLVIPAGVFAAKPPPPPPVDIQLVNVSDWHGQLDPQLMTIGGVPNTPVGGAWSISSRWALDRLAKPTLTLTAGDDFGATPPLSGFFNEAPAVLAQRLMGIQVGTFGNHNFDRGIAHLQTMIDLAAAPTDADHPGQPFRYVAAN